MKVQGHVLLMVLPVLASSTTGADAPVGFPQQAPIVGHDCSTHDCRLVPATKQIKKTVYEVQQVPYCLKKLPPLRSLFHHRPCDDCGMSDECQCVRYKKVLVKREVVCKEICTSKCVVENYVERVPCLPNRK